MKHSDRSSSSQPWFATRNTGTWKGFDRTILRLWVPPLRQSMESFTSWESSWNCSRVGSRSILGCLDSSRLICRCQRLMWDNGSTTTLTSPTDWWLVNTGRWETQIMILSAIVADVVNITPPKIVASQHDVLILCENTVLFFFAWMVCTIKRIRRVKALRVKLKTWLIEHTLLSRDGLEPGKRLFGLQSELM